MDLSNVDSPQKGNFLVAFADIHNFLAISRLLADPVSLFELLDGAASIVIASVAGTPGRVVKFIGDACLMIFPEEAVDVGTRCLLDIKERLEAYLGERSLPNRVQITAHLGEIAVGQFGRVPDRRLDVYGDAVNLAFGLGRGEHRGQVVLSRSAFDRLSPVMQARFREHTEPPVYEYRVDKNMERTQ